MKNQEFVVFLFLLISLFLFLSVSDAKTFKRCEFAELLKSKGLDKFGNTHLQDWVCLANYASKFNTKVRGRHKHGHQHNIGIFQISSRRWCATGSKKPNFGCKIKCKALWDDDITDDIECAKKIASGRRGMNHWEGWRKNCKGKDLSRWTKNCKV
ncbi:lysozyme C-1-like [Paroedura picta]|uniref:lysozyme C-1-like n=1 Tax=Paroedura picta TaxID=143630 RepID=UPI00405722E4